MYMYVSHKIILMSTIVTFTPITITVVITIVIHIMLLSMNIFGRRTFLVVHCNCTVINLLKLGSTCTSV